MSLAGITFSGLASGLDSRAIINALMAVERRPIRALELQKQTLERQKGLFGDLEGMLEKLRDKADAIRKATDFLAFEAEVDDDSRLSASASSGATAGTYDVKVLQLARAEVSSSLGKADKDTTQYGDGTLTITIDGTTHEITVDDASSTLEGIAAAINAEGIDVQAQVLDTGVGSDPYQLVLTGKKTGADAAFSVSTKSGASASLAALATEIDGNEVSAALDSRIDVNGIVVERSSNAITDAITGVTLNLKSEDATAVTKVTVSADASATAAKVEEFVDAYNEIIDFVEAQSEVDDEGNTRALLFGDSTLRSIRASLRSALGSSVDTGNPSFELLSQVGVESDVDGRLTFDQSEFEKALETDEDAVRDLFAKKDAGVASLVHTRTDDMLDSVDGLIAARLEGFQGRIKATDRRIEVAERRLERLEDQLTRRFAALESMISRLQGQGSALGAIGQPLFSSPGGSS